MRRGRVVDRIELRDRRVRRRPAARRLGRPTRRARRRRAAAVLRGARAAARGARARRARRRRSRGDRDAGCPTAPAAACGSLVPQRGEKRGLLDLATRNAAMAYQTHFGEGADAAFDALDTLARVLALPVAAAAHRMLRHLDAPGPRDRRVDGRVRRRTDAAGRVPEVQDQGLIGRSALTIRPRIGTRTADQVAGACHAWQP